MFSAKHNKNRALVVGKLGESLACEYLVKKRHIIVDRNYRRKFGEIDIISISPDKTLIFSEVKTMSVRNEFSEGLSPEDNLTFFKAIKIKRMAQFFATQNPRMIDDGKGWRIDLIVVVLAEYPNHGYKIKRIAHYENI